MPTRAAIATSRTFANDDTSQDTQCERRLGERQYQLAYKYIRDVVERPELYRAILAVTFTNKATEEMKSRILRELHALSDGSPSGYLADLCRELGMDERSVRKRASEAQTRILHDYSRFTVLTIDRFFQRIVRAFIKELGIDLDYNIELETDSILARSADALIEEILEDKQLERWLAQYMAENDVTTIVVGKPMQTNGRPSDTWRFVEPLTARLRRAYPDKEVVLYDERFTSVLAHRTMLESGIGREARRDKALVDRISATIILQSYMESEAMRRR